MLRRVLAVMHQQSNQYQKVLKEYSLVVTLDCEVE